MRRYSECMGLIENEVGEDSENPNLLVVRAQMHILFGQVRPDSCMWGHVEMMSACLCRSLWVMRMCAVH